MSTQKKIACIIPARLNSSRFPKKLLYKIANKPILQWVWEAANKTSFFCDVTFAIDSQEVADVIKSFGGKYIMTSESCKTGTDRLIEVIHSGKVDADIIVNWQGDEPFITPEMIKTLLQSCQDDCSDMWSLKKRIIKEEDIPSPNIAKVVCNAQGHAMYFSRSTIPFYRDSGEEKIYYKHVGLYAFKIETLRKIAKIPQDCYLEDAEKLEQLRFLYHNITIKLHETDQEVVGIDTPQDLQKAEEYLKTNK